MLERLRAKRNLIDRIASLSPLSDVRAFGSVARGEETATSDVDLDPGRDAEILAKAVQL
jgi:predicted nucleotidyltransferase